ncbi:MAG: type I restriction-modification system subunit M N-terminal domain-containing protein [Planctomycetaceae bacterium]|nr:type I restriction-modification system subunit M N-terminal domain-containing protein [Planctomycetaceae bacterium]
MNKQQLAAKIWESANQIRSKIEANEYKDYILGFIFYKYVSDRQVQFARHEEFSDDDFVPFQKTTPRPLNTFNATLATSLPTTTCSPRGSIKAAISTSQMSAMPFRHLVVSSIQTTSACLNAFSKLSKLAWASSVKRLRNRRKPLVISSS